MIPWNIFSMSSFFNFRFLKTSSNLDKTMSIFMDKGWMEFSMRSTLPCNLKNHRKILISNHATLHQKKFVLIKVVIVDWIVIFNFCLNFRWPHSPGLFSCQGPRWRRSWSYLCNHENRFFEGKEAYQLSALQNYLHHYLSPRQQWVHLQ